MKKQIAALLVFCALTIFVFAAFPVSAALPTKLFDIPESGLWFPFDGNAEEASGAVTGKLRGSPRFVEGRDGTPDGAIYFETEEQSVALQLNDIEGDWTASFWVRPAAAQSYHAFLCSSLTGSLRMVQDDGMVGATMNGIVDRSVPYQIPIGTWTMLTFAYDDNSEVTSVYVNGEFFDGMLGWQTLGLTLIGNDAPEQKGWQSAPEYALDDTWFFGRLLSDDDIRSLYADNAVPAPPAVPAEEPEPEPEDPQDPAAPEAPAAPADPAEPSEPEDEGEEDDFDDFESDEFAGEEENGPRERKPGALFAMAAVSLCALFLVCAGARALFGRSAL